MMKPMTITELKKELKKLDHSELIERVNNQIASSSNIGWGYGMDFIAGFTENGLPYGTFIEEIREKGEITIQDILFASHDELPF